MKHTLGFCMECPASGITDVLRTVNATFGTYSSLAALGFCYGRREMGHPQVYCTCDNHVYL
jgi:hypothetical protein